MRTRKSSTLGKTDPRLRGGLLVLCLLLPLPSLAETADWNLAQLMLRLSQVKQRENRFTETRELSLLEHKLESQGRLTFSAPDRLSKVFDPPNSLAYSIEGNKLTIRKSDGAGETVRLDHSPQLLAYIASLRAVLAGDIPTLSVYFDSELKGSADQWHLSLLPRDPKLLRQVSHIEINGRQTQIDQFIVYEQGGDRIFTQLHQPRED